MRTLGFLLTIVLAIVVGGPRNRPLAPNYVESPAVRSTVIALDARDMTRDRVGALRFLGGWQLDSISPQWSGLSALQVDGSWFIAIGDAGTVIRFRLTRFGRVIDTHIESLPAGCGQSDDRRARDAEGLTGDGANWWVSYESNTRICRLSADLDRAEALATPPAMRQWRKGWGPEAILRLGDGRMLVFSERPPLGRSRHELLVFDGDPTESRTPVRTLSYLPPHGYSPVDAAELPDGRVLVLTRRFTPWHRFTTALTIIDRVAFDGSTPVEGQVIARFQPPLVSDNFEGVAVSRDGAQTIVWLASDNNSMSWQRTYLLKFALDPQSRGTVRPPVPSASSPSRSSASAAGP